MATRRASVLPTVPEYAAGQLASHGLPVAGFWQRVAAFVVDLVILVPLSQLVQATFTVVLFAGVLVWWGYFTLFECSGWQATPGKRLIGLKVTDVNGVHIRHGRATARFFSKLLSAAILGLGFLLPAFTRHKQALHDLVAGTLVLTRT